MEIASSVSLNRFVTYVMNNDMTKRINKHQALALLNASLDPSGDFTLDGETLDKINVYLRTPDTAPFDKRDEYAFVRLIGTLRRALIANAHTMPPLGGGRAE